MKTLIGYLTDTEWHLYMKVGSIVLIVLIFIGLVATILMENRNPVKAIAYILVLVFIPIVGLIIYYYLGRDLRKRRRFTLKGSKDEVLFLRYWESQRSEIEQMQMMLRQQFGSKQELSAMLLNTRQSVLSRNNHVQILVNGEEKFPAVFSALRAAQHHIHIEYYMVTDDEVGRELTEILIEKLNVGVQVRFIYDDMGSNRIGKIPGKLQEHGASVYPFSPVLVDFYLNANYRNHRKIIVIDGKVGFVGGINLDERYINNGKYPTYWRDTHLRIEGDAVNLLQLQFLMSYRYCSKDVFPFAEPFFGRSQLKGNSFVDIVASGPDSEWPIAMQSILMAINVAKKTYPDH